MPGMRTRRAHVSAVCPDFGQGAAHVGAVWAAVLLYKIRLEDAALSERRKIRA